MIVINIADYTSTYYVIPTEYYIEHSYITYTLYDVSVRLLVVILQVHIRGDS